MTGSPKKTNQEPYPYLMRTRSLIDLWMVRMLVLLAANEDPDLQSRLLRPALQRLEVPFKEQAANDAAALVRRQRLGHSLVWMEQRRARYRLPRILQENLELLGRQCDFNLTERTILALAVAIGSNADLRTVIRTSEDDRTLPEQIHAITRLGQSRIRKALSTSSSLRKSGMVDIDGGRMQTFSLQLSRASLRILADVRLTRIDDLFLNFIRECPAPQLSRADYTHLSPGFDLAAGLVGNAVRSRRNGVNILLHGPPGTGKTQLARAIAAEVGVTLFEVSCMDEDQDAMKPMERLSSAATAQRLLAYRPAALVFDEIDVIFSRGNRLFDLASTADATKAWVNSILENTPVPTLWIANSLEGMDPAFVRRFDLALEVGTPPLARRMELLERECGDLVDDRTLRRIAQSEHTTPAILTRAADVLRRVDLPGHANGRLLEAIVDGTLKAQQHPGLDANRSMQLDGYDPSLCNSSQDLAELAHGLASARTGRVCLYGPPGTGKTAFGHWLAQRMNRPLILKRISDLQSPYLGVMERNLARCFEQAARDDAILQLDEVDTYLRSRESARQRWEVSQVNEFLTQLESHEGIFIASTNLMDGLDKAALRRFDYKIRIGYLRQEQAQRMLDALLQCFGIAPDSGCGRPALTCERLTPGDFAVIRRRHRLVPFRSANAVIQALHEEVELKGPTPNRIGFL